MTGPVTGPLFKSVDHGTSYYSQRWGYSQKRPFDLVLPLTFQSCKMLQNDNLAAASTYIGSLSSSSSCAVAANSKAYDKFKDAISDRASLGATLAEIGESWDMIYRRGVQLAAFALALKQRKFKLAAKVLNVEAPKRRSRHKDFASHWLEFSFGWSPLVGDIYSAIDVVQKPIKPKKVRVASQHTTYLPMGPNGGGYTKRFMGGEEAATVQMGAYVEVNNPNLWLANQLGLINPATVLWEVIPFSFVVDWFINVEQVLGSYSDFYGLNLASEFTTVFIEADHRYQWVWESTRNYPHMVLVQRTTGVTKPGLFIRPLKAPSVKRALNAISVLAGFLKR